MEVLLSRVENNSVKINKENHIRHISQNNWLKNL